MVLKKGSVIVSRFMRAWCIDDLWHDKELVWDLPCSIDETLKKIKPEIVDVSRALNYLEFDINFIVMEDIDTKDICDYLYTSCSIAMNSFGVHPRQHFIEGFEPIKGKEDHYLIYLGT